MGDFNSQIGKRYPEESKIMGPYNYGNRNTRGERLIDFCVSNNLKIVNTLFKKRTGRRWTWVAPNEEIKTQIDYILVPSFQNNIKDFNVLGGFQFYSDHRPIEIKLTANTRSRKTKIPLNSQKLNETNKKQYEKLIETQINNLDKSNDLEVNEMEKKINDIIFHATKAIKTGTKNNSNTWPQEINDLIKKRQELLKISKRKTNEKIELNLICKLIKKKLRDWNETKRNQMIQEVLETTKSTKTIRNNISTGRQWINKLQNNSGEQITDRKEINKTASSYYKELYENKLDTKFNMEITTEEIPSILTDEVRGILKKLKNGKAPGHDQTRNEQLKYGGEAMAKLLTEHYNKILKEKTIPKEWNKSDIILLHKKGDKSLIKNYRPISLSPSSAKTFSKLIEQRIQKQIQEQQPHEQAGFRHGFSTIDHLQVINQLIEQAQEYETELHLAFIDYTKAFDSLNHNFLLSALQKQCIPPPYIQIIQEMYLNLQARIITDTTGEYFQIQKGIRQGDPLSPILFNVALEEIFKKINWEGRGIPINGEYIICDSRTT